MVSPLYFLAYFEVRSERKYNSLITARNLHGHCCTRIAAILWHMGTYSLLS